MIGQQFGHYEFESRLGSGGMGVVYLARDTRLDRRVAIKVLPDGRVADELARTRFHREAQALSRLNHPNIATIYDFDQQDGRDFLVMEYIEGQSLRDVGPDPLPSAEVVRLGTQLAEALVAAHGAGVVHLDLKPGNLMLTADGRLKVLDFGIARLHAPDFGAASTQTVSPEKVTVANDAGTPPYMAPEQVASGPLDSRTDIYSAGATLYELATGRRVFDQPRGAGLYEAILRQKPDPPSRHNADVSAKLEGALLKALEKQPAKRQQTAQELLRDMQGAADSAAGSPFRAHRWTRRELALTVAASLAAIAATGYALWPVPARARFHERGFALIGDVENRTDDPLLSRTVGEALTIALQQSQFVNLVSRDRVADTLRRMNRPPATPVDEATGREICRREGVPLFIAGAVSRSGQTTQLTVKVLEAGGSLLFAESAEYRGPDELFGKVDALASRVRQNLGESLAGIAKSSQPLAKVTTRSLDALGQYSRAVQARAMGELSDVEAPLLAALQLDPDFAMAHLKLGDYYMDVAGDDVKARPEFDSAYRLKDRVTDREKYFIESQYFSFHEQYEHSRNSLKALTQIYPDDPEFHYELAAAYYALEQIKEGITELDHAIRFNPHGVRAHGSLVLFLARDNQPDAALKAFDEALRQGIDSPYLYWALGLAWVAKNDLARARGAFEKLGEAPGYYRHLSLLQQARVSLYAGDLPDALTRLRGVVDLTHREEDGALELAARVLLGRTAALTGDMALARAQAVAVRDFTATSDRPADIRDAGTLALAAGDAAAAKTSLARLAQLQSDSPTPLVLGSRLSLESEIALQERHNERALRLADEAGLRRHWYGSMRVAAMACEAAGDAAGAVERWQSVLNLKGQILQDGFPPDIGLARAHLVRLRSR
jgi:eukaryotic-like serine/threonine-protein kinase